MLGHMVQVVLAARLNLVMGGQLGAFEMEKVFVELLAAVGELPTPLGLVAYVHACGHNLEATEPFVGQNMMIRLFRRKEERKSAFILLTIVLLMIIIVIISKTSCFAFMRWGYRLQQEGCGGHIYLSCCSWAACVRQLYLTTEKTVLYSG